MSYLGNDESSWCTRFDKDKVTKVSAICQKLSNKCVRVNNQKDGYNMGGAYSKENKYLYVCYNILAQSV